MSQAQGVRLPTFSAANYMDNDAYGLDLRANMTARADYVISASLVSIVRQDGQAIKSGDLEIINVGVVPQGTIVPTPSGPVTAPLGMFVSFQGLEGLANSSYLVTILLTLASSNTVNRTVVINTLPFVG